MVGNYSNSQTYRLVCLGRCYSGVTVKQGRLASAEALSHAGVYVDRDVKHSLRVERRGAPVLA